MTHHFLYWLGTGWWCLDLVHALLLCMSKTCPLLMHLLWSGGSSAHFTTYLWLLMAWVIFWFPICYGLLPLGAEICLIVGFSSFSLLFYSFRNLTTISCCTTLSFLLWCYLTQACWAFLGLLLILLSMTQHGHWAFYYIACGLLCPINFLLGILSPFAFLGLPWPFF